jgi:hypothetical protein
VEVNRGKWPSIVDDEWLEGEIKAARQKLHKQFYESSVSDPHPCQGDVLRLATDVPVIDADGDVAAQERIEHWLVVANTCDIERAFENLVDFVPIVPLVAVHELASEMPESFQKELEAYHLSRMFYVPGWAPDVAPHFADFERIVPLHRVAIQERAQIVARMRREPWVLLNSCLVRLLCRPDGRHE